LTDKSLRDGVPRLCRTESTPDTPEMQDRKPRVRSRQRALIRARGVEALDKRTAPARELMRRRAELLADLGGEAELSAQQRAVAEAAVREAVVLDLIDRELFDKAGGGLTDEVRQLIRERGNVSDRVVRHYSALGLERRAKRVPLIREWMRAQPQQDAASEAQARVVEVQAISAETTPQGGAL
jgi:hypothetical protein